MWRLVEAPAPASPVPGWSGLWRGRPGFGLLCFHHLCAAAGQACPALGCPSGRQAESTSGSSRASYKQSFTDSPGLRRFCFVFWPISSPSCTDKEREGRQALTLPVYSAGTELASMFIISFSPVPTPSRGAEIEALRKWWLVRGHLSVRRQNQGLNLGLAESRPSLPTKP